MLYCISLRRTENFGFKFVFVTWYIYLIFRLNPLTPKLKVFTLSYFFDCQQRWGNGNLTKIRTQLFSSMLFPIFSLREHKKLIFPKNFAIKKKISTNFWGHFSKKVIFSNRLITRIGLFSSKVVQFLYVLQNHVFRKNLFLLVFSKWRLEKCKVLNFVKNHSWVILVQQLRLDFPNSKWLI